MFSVGWGGSGQLRGFEGGRERWEYPEGKHANSRSHGECPGRRNLDEDRMGKGSIPVEFADNKSFYQEACCLKTLLVVFKN